MNNIETVHENVFNYLNNWNEHARMNHEINPFFYLRTLIDNKFKQGFWFPGNDSFLCISFWAGGDSINKTSNIYFEINKELGCRVVIVAKDSESKHIYFKKLVSILNIERSKYTSQKKSKIWIKKISSNWENWANDLGNFISTDKAIIDNFLNNNEIVYNEEFVSKFEFIKPVDFDTMYSYVLKERDRIKEEQLKKNAEFRTQSKLPFALLGISIENFQGIKSTNISDLRPDAKWIFITGENGYGKTTILQSIALALSNDPDVEKYLEDKSRINIELATKDEKAFLFKTKESNQKETQIYSQYIVGYGPVRLNVQSISSENKENRSHNHVLSLFENETLLRNINYELFASSYTDTKTFLHLEEIIQTVTKGRISEIKVYKREVLFVEMLPNGEELPPLPLDKLAAGFRSIINIVIDIYLRFKKIFYNINYQQFYGIVLIDEIENHLHPILQRDLPLTLSQVFPNIQFIVSTHSPIPLLAAEKNSIILKVNRNKDVGVTLERLDEIIDFPNLLPNTILTSPIFGFQNIFSENKDNNEFIRIENTYNEVLQNNEKIKIIDSYLTQDTMNAIMNILNKK